MYGLMNKPRELHDASHSSLRSFLIILAQLICLPLLLFALSVLIRRNLDLADRKMGVEAFKQCLLDESARMAEQRGNPDKCNDWEFVRDVYISKVRQ